MSSRNPTKFKMQNYKSTSNISVAPGTSSMLMKNKENSGSKLEIATPSGLFPSISKNDALFEKSPIVK